MRWRPNPALSAASRAIVHAVDEVQLYREICSIAVQSAGFRLAWIGLVDEASGDVHPAAVAGEPADYVADLRLTVRGVPEARGGGGTAMREARTVVCQDIGADPLMARWREKARRHGLLGCAALPLRRGGTVIGSINVYAATVEFFDAEVVSLLEQMAADMSYSLDAISTERERRRAVRSAEELTSIVNRSHAVFFRWRAAPGWPVEMVSDNVSVFGYAPQDFVSTHVPYDSIVHPEDLSRLDSEQERWTREGRGEFRQQYRIRTKAGEWRWVEDRTWVECAAGGAATHHQGLILDITERITAEQALRESEHRFRALVEQSIAGIWILQDGKVAYANPRAAEILGYPQAQMLIGRDPAEFVAAKDRAAAAENIRHLLTGEMSSIAATFTGLRKDGGEVIVGVNGILAAHDGRPAIVGIMQDISERKRAEDQVKRYIAQLEQAMLGTVGAVSAMVELRDPYTAGHERRVGLLARAIGEELGLAEDDCKSLQIMGAVHDIGKIATPAEILSKPGRISPAEFEIIKTHARLGYEILKDVRFPWPVSDAILQHHERLDGSGYPQGLKDGQICLEARILAVADVVEAMSSHRPYRPALGLSAALEEIERFRGTRFDARAADACLRLFRDKGYVLNG